MLGTKNNMKTNFYKYAKTNISDFVIVEKYNGHHHSNNHFFCTTNTNDWLQVSFKTVTERFHLRVST